MSIFQPTSHRLNLRAKFIILFVGLVLLPLLTVGPITIIRLRSALRDSAFNLNRQTAQSAAEQIRSFIEIQFKVLNDMGVAYPEFNSLSDQALQNFVERVLYKNENFIDIAVTNKSGAEIVRKNVVRVIPTQSLINRSGSEEFEVVRNQGYYLGPIYIETGKPFLNIGKAIIDTNGVFQGALLVKIDARNMQHVVSRISTVGERGRAYVVNRKGIIVAHPDISQVLAERDVSQIPSVAVLINGTTPIKGSELYHNELNIEVIGAGVPIILAFSDKNSVPTPWFVIVEQPTKLVLSIANQITQFGWLLFMAAILIAMSVALIFANRMVHPIELLQQASRQFGSGNLGYRVAIHTNDEIEELANGFNTMAEQLRQSIVDIQKEQSTLLAERNKLEVILSGITDAVIAVDLERHIILFNATAERLIGLQTKNVLGKPIDKVIKLFNESKEITSDQYCPIQLDGGGPAIFNGIKLRMLNARNQEYFVNIISGQIKESEHINLGCIMTLHDITREQLIEKMKTEFVFIAAHQLRTPLTGIKWSLNAVLEGEAGKLSPAQHEFLEKSYASNERMIRLIDDLLNTARLEEGRYVTHTTLTNIRHIIETLFSELKKISDKRKVTFVFKKSSQTIPDIRVDPDAIKVALENVIENAIKYTPAGGEVIVSLAHNHQYIEVLVRDTGIGISKEQQNRIFSKFFRADNAISAETDGSGLGLFIVKNIIEAHGGHITFVSNEHKGSLFTIALPIT